MLTSRSSSSTSPSRARLIDALLFSLAIAIGITPQLLPAIVSVSLSSGSRALARKRVLVKRLVTIEDLGNIEVLFTDKTGTLTEGASPSTSARRRRAAERRDPAPRPAVQRDDVTGTVRSEATRSTSRSFRAGCRLSLEAGGVTGSERVGLRPFDHERRLASVVGRIDGSDALLITKGAPEAALARCYHVPQRRTGARPAVRRGREGCRGRDAPGDRHRVPDGSRRARSRVAGFLTFVDRPKADAGAAVAELERWGSTSRSSPVTTAPWPPRSAATSASPVAGVLTGGRSSSSTTTRSPPRSPARQSSPGSARTEVAPRSRSRGARRRRRVPRRRRQRRRRPARRRRRDLGGLGDRGRQGRGRHRAARQGSRRAGRRLVEGRRIFANTLKYVLMATSSNFGNMFSAAGASLFLSFLPMLPSQILLNNLLYDVGQMAIPTDRVDPESWRARRPGTSRSSAGSWACSGPLSSIFDFATFFVMLRDAATPGTASSAAAGSSSRWRPRRS